MPRSHRRKSKKDAFYHLFNRVAGPPDFYPFQDPVVARKFISLLEFYLKLYCLRLVAFELMGNHYHAISFFRAFVQLAKDELQRRAQLRWGSRWQERTAHWQEADWQQFNRHLFDVSRFMQHVNGEFAKWYNRHTGRRGHFWADRFKNPELVELKALQDCTLYVELNAVRAELVQRPEDWKWGSAYWRWSGQRSQWLMPLSELFADYEGPHYFEIYRGLLYYRGAVPHPDKPGVIPESVLQQERQRGFTRPGVFRQHLRFFNDGVVIGSAERVQQRLREYREKGWYLRRRHPIPQLEGRLYSLREQRSHAWSPK